jgi:hypothetical protein
VQPLFTPKLGKFTLDRKESAGGVRIEKNLLIKDICEPAGKYSLGEA